MGQINKKFTYEEVASVLGISRTTIYNWQKSGILPTGDYDIEKLENAANAVIDMKQEETKREIEQIKTRLHSYKMESFSE